MQIEQVAAGTPLWDSFQALPARVYAGDPRWIPADPTYQAFQLSESHPFRKYGQVQAFVAHRDGEVAARCAAMLNPRMQVPEQPAGLVGFFDSLDDYDATAAVLDAAVTWLRDRGAKTIQGPMNLSVWHQYRLMTRGFDTVPFLGEPYNPRYYPEFFERFGFARHARWRSWDLAEPHMKGLVASVMRVPRETLAKAGFTARRIGPDDYDAILPTAHDLLNSGFSDNLGYAAIDFDEFKTAFEPMKALIVPGAQPAAVYDPAGDPCAWGYVYPDLGPQVRAAAGLATPDLKAMTNPHRGKRAVLHTMVVLPQYRGTGIVNAMLGQTIVPPMVEHGFLQGIGAVAKDGRTAYDKLGDHTREYHLYELQ